EVVALQRGPVLQHCLRVRNARWWGVRAADRRRPQRGGYPARVSSGVNAAWTTLQGTGQVSLPGAPAVWSSATRWLLLVLMGLVGLLAVGGVVAVPVALIARVEITAAMVFGFLSAYAMLAVL